MRLDEFMRGLDRHVHPPPRIWTVRRTDTLCREMGGLRAVGVEVSNYSRIDEEGLGRSEKAGAAWQDAQRSTRELAEEGFSYGRQGRQGRRAGRSISPIEAKLEAPGATRGRCGRRGLYDAADQPRPCDARHD